MASQKLGKLAEPRKRFCPFGAVSAFPYRYMYGEESEANTVAEKFFVHGRFRERGWNIYYLRSLPKSILKPLLFIPRDEVECLFKDIEHETGIKVQFPDPLKFPGFDLDFDLDGCPRPRYLGYFDDLMGIVELEDSIPDEGMAPEEKIDLEDRSFPAFRRKMDAAILAVKSHNRKMKDRKKKARVIQKQRWCYELKRTQCYLGLRPRITTDLEEFPLNPNATYEDSQVEEKAFEMAAGMHVSKPNAFASAAYLFHMDVVFVCIDIEAYERDWRKLTEIGVATLDTRDLVGIPPGEGGIKWMQKMRNRHFRIVEHAHLINRDFVDGCPDNFMDEFGTSEWISTHQIPQVVATCFRAPFSKPGQYHPYPADRNEVPRGGLHVEPMVDSDYTEKRNIVFVGHEFKSDLNYLRGQGYDISTLSNLTEAIDTNDLYRAWKHEYNAVKLGVVLYHLELVGWHLHNAGNDAAYTLQSLIGIALAALDPEQKAKTAVAEEDLRRATEDAQQRLVEENEEWLVADEDRGDGGDPVSLDRLDMDQQLLKGQKAEEKEAHKEHSRSLHAKGNKTMGRATKPGPSSQPAGSAAVSGASTHGGSSSGRGRGSVKDDSQHNRGGRHSGRGNRGNAGTSKELSEQTKSRMVIFDDEDLI